MRPRFIAALAALVFSSSLAVAQTERPVITAFEPAEADAGTDLTIMIRGRNFTPQTRITWWAEPVFGPVQYVSPAELRLPVRLSKMGNITADRALTVPLDNGGPFPYSAPFMVRSINPRSNSPFTIGPAGVSLRVAPSSRTTWLGGLQELRGIITFVHRTAVAVDDDHDGVVRINYGAGFENNGGAWIAFNETTGQVLAVDANGPQVAVRPLRSPMVFRGPSGALTEVLQTTPDSGDVVWVRPGVGSWVLYDSDYLGRYGSMFSTRSDWWQMQAPAVPVPSSFEPNDQFLVLDHHDDHAYVPYSGRVADLLDRNESPGQLDVLPAGGGYDERFVRSIPFRVLRSGGTSGVVSADYVTTGDVVTAGRLVFGDGELFKTIHVPVEQDAVYGSRRVELRLQHPAGATLGDTTAVVFISDVSPPPDVAITDVAVREGDNGRTRISIPVTLTGATRREARVRWRDGSATPSSGTLVFAPGETSKTIELSTEGNTTPEANRSITVLLLGADDASIARGEGKVTIVDDDGPRITIDDAVAREGDAGTVTANVTVRFTQAAVTPFSINYTTADGTARAGSDFRAAAGTLHFQPGDTRKSIAIEILGDGVFEADESFAVRLSGSNGPFVADDTALFTIENDDAAPPELSIVAPRPVEEGAPGDRARFEIGVRLAAASALPVSVAWRTIGESATPHQDFVPAAGTLLFAPGEVVKQIVVPIIGDAEYEPAEVFWVELRGATNAAIVRSTAACVIANDDESAPAPPPVPIGVSVSDVRVTEGAAAVFTIRLSEAAAAPVTVVYATREQSAREHSDYSPAAGSVTIAPGNLAAQVRIGTVHDSLPEPDETFILRLTSAIGADVEGGDGHCTIADDDAPR